MTEEALLKRHSIFGCQVIQEVATLLKAPQIVVVTAQSILHRFFARKSISKYDAFTVAMGCYLLATKVEEKLVPLRDVIIGFHYLFLIKQGGTLQISPLDPSSDVYCEWKNELICIERNILRELGFSLYNSFSHPHQYLLYVIKLLEGDDLLAQKSWNYINDSMHINLIVEYNSLYIVCAAIFLASRTLSYPLPESPTPWWKLLNLDTPTVHKIANEIMSLYEYEKIQWLDGLCEVPYLEKTRSFHRMR